MRTVLAWLKKQPDVYPFKEPVNWQEMGLFDYPQIIETPMDLGTVEAKLENGEYTTASECAEDIRLVWRNCMTYNADGSDFYQIAEKLAKKFEDKVRPVLRLEQQELQESDKPPTPEERTVFSHNLFALRMQELGNVVQKLDAHCPTALEKKIDEDVVEIDVDKIDPTTFRELERYVKENIPSTENAKGAAKKRKSGGTQAPAKRSKN